MITKEFTARFGVGADAAGEYLRRVRVERRNERTYARLTAAMENRRQIAAFITHARRDAILSRRRSRPAEYA